MGVTREAHLIEQGNEFSLKRRIGDNVSMKPKSQEMDDAFARMLSHPVTYRYLEEMPHATTDEQLSNEPS